MEKSKFLKDRESGRVIGGLILIAVGAALLLRNIGFAMPSWLYSWPMILILVGTYIGFKSNFRNNSWFVLIAVGGFFLVSKFIPQLGLQPLFWPCLIIGLGLLFMLKPGRSNSLNSKSNIDYTGGQQVSVNSLPDMEAIASADLSDYMVVESVFSGVNRKVISKDFRGGHITSVFGGTKIDLSQADITRPIIIKLDIVFGGTKLIVPPHWAIMNEFNGAFHGVDDKRSFNPSASLNPEKVVILKGSVVFGGLEITSY